MHGVSRYCALLVVLGTLPLSGCLFRSREVHTRLSNVPLKTASQEDLLAYVNNQADKIQSMQATVDIDTSVGGAKKGTITDYKEIRGYILARKPAMLRMIGLMPIVRTQAFDMVSDGQQFKLWVPPKNRFVIGRNDEETTHPKQALENMRPQVIYEALLIRHIDPANEIAVMENGNEQVYDGKGHWMDQPDYEIVVVRKGDHGWYLSRKIIFDRADLAPDRQLIYDEHGNLATDARYAKYKDYNGVSFPSRIEIKRPQEEYDITLGILKLEVNGPMPDDKFVLQQPAGAEVVNLDHAGSGNSTQGGDDPK